ncbi:MAG: hypothetical protein AAF806_05800 [Bacteroidota bacterium]
MKYSKKTFVNAHYGMAQLHNRGLDEIAAIINNHESQIRNLKRNIIGTCASFVSMLDCVCQEHIQYRNDNNDIGKIPLPHHSKNYIEYYQHIGYTLEITDYYSINEICQAGEYPDSTNYFIEDIFSLGSEPSVDDIIGLLDKIEVRVIENDRSTVDKDLLLKVLAIGKASANYFHDKMTERQEIEEKQEVEEKDEWSKLKEEKKKGKFELKEVVKDDMKGVFTKGIGSLVEDAFAVGESLLMKGVTGTLASTLGNSAWSVGKQLFFNDKKQ